MKTALILSSTNLILQKTFIYCRCVAILDIHKGLTSDPVTMNFTILIIGFKDIVACIFPCYISDQRRRFDTRSLYSYIGPAKGPGPLNYTILVGGFIDIISMNFGVVPKDVGVERMFEKFGTFCIFGPARQAPNEILHKVILVIQVIENIQTYVQLATNIITISWVSAKKKINYKHLLSVIMTFHRLKSTKISIKLEFYSNFCNRFILLKILKYRNYILLQCMGGG